MNEELFEKALSVSLGRFGYSTLNSISMLANRSHNFNVSELNPRTDFTIALFLVEIRNPRRAFGYKYNMSVQLHYKTPYACYS